jgi:oxaloacetate decarboxylase alpha subunit
MGEMVEFVDTTVRDGNQSLWDSTGLNTAKILSFAPFLDRAGFKAVELATGVNFKIAVAYQKENPWERMRLVCKAMPKTPLRYGGTFRRFITFKWMPDSVNQLHMKLVADCGLRSVWIVDGSYDMEFFYKAARWAKEAGFEEVVAELSYTISPVHTDEFYAQKTRELAKCPDFDTLCIKDQGGLLTPDRVRTLVPAVLPNASGKPVELHAHCNTGLCTVNHLEAVTQGIRTVWTAIPPLAYGTSHPSVFNIIKNLHYMGYSTNLDEEALEAVSERLRAIAQRDGRPEGVIPEYDYFYYQHQVPGGMMTTLKRQLAEVGMEHRMDEVLKEVARVRAELGYPIMVTPFSQFVGTQAALNVITGERYKVIPDAVIEYAAGRFGPSPAPIDQNILDKIASAPKAKAIFDKEPAQLSMKELRQQTGIGPDVSDEEFVLRYAMSKHEVDAMLAAGPIKTAYP